MSCRQRTGAQVGWLPALCPVRPLDEHTLLMDVGKQVEEMPGKAPRWWEVGGRAKFRTRVLALGEAGPFCGTAGCLLPEVHVSSRRGRVRRGIRWVGFSPI